MTWRDAVTGGSVLVALDPGTRRAGLAIAVDGAIVKAHSLDTGRARVDMMLGALLAVLPEPGVRVASLVSEWPTLYRGAATRAARADLVAMREVVKGVEGWGWASTRRAPPARWKGQVPKPIIHARAARLLNPAEVAATGWDTLGPDGRDAVGICLWALGRLAGRG